MLGEVLDVQGSQLRVQYGHLRERIMGGGKLTNGAAARWSEPDVDMWFDEHDANFLLPYPRVAPEQVQVTIEADKWLETAANIPWTGLMRGVRPPYL